MTGWPWADALDVARKLRDEGGSPIPVTVSKRPPAKIGREPFEWAPFQSRAATDDELQAWFGDGNRRRYGVALVTGSISGVVVLDGDNHHNNGHVQRGSRELVRRGAFDVPTRWRRTPAGVHVFYAHPGYRVPNSSGETGWLDIRDVDVRGDGGYVVFWLPGYREGGDGPLAPMPSWARPAQVHELVHTPPADQEHWLMRVLHGVSQGERNSTCARLCGYYLSIGMVREVAREHLLDWAAQCTPPMDPAEVERTLASVWKNEQAQQERAIAKEVASLSVRQEARRRLRAGTFQEPPTPMTAADLLAVDFGTQAWSIEELLSAGGNALLAGQFKAGKTTLLLTLARAFCDGKPFLGRFATALDAGRTVAYFNYELTDRALQAWVARLGLHHPERLIVANLRGHGLHLEDAEAAEWVVRWLREHNADVWMIDPFARAYGGEENDNSAVSRFTEAIDIIKQRAGVAVAVLAAHFGRQSFEPGQEHARGATRLDDWADARWIETRTDDDERFLMATGRDVDVREARLVWNPEALSLTMVEGNRKERGGDKAEAAILDYIDQVRGRTGEALRSAITSKAIDESVPGDNNAIRAARKRLVDKRSLFVVEGPHGEKWHYPENHPEAGQGVLA